MGITKQDVRDFINEQVAKNTKIVQKQIDTFHENHVDPVLTTVLKDKLGEVPKLGKQIMDTYDKGLTEWLKASGGVTEYDLGNRVSYVRTYTSQLHGTVRNNLRSKIINKINGGTDAPNYHDARLDDMVRELQSNEELRELLKRKKGLEALKNELIAVVDSMSSGKGALARIEILGVDIKEFVEKTNANLPAIINLSADVCLLNGTC